MMSAVEGKEWEIAAHDLLQKFNKHDWVSSKKDGGQRYLFFVPVVTAFPSIAADYGRVIKRPMDLGTVRLVCNGRTDRQTRLLFFRDVESGCCSCPPHSYFSFVN